MNEPDNTLSEEDIKQLLASGAETNTPEEQSRFEAMMRKDAVEETELRDELNSYAEALRQEFEAKQNNTSSAEETAENTKEFLRKNVHSAAAQVVWLSNNADSESVRLNASKYIVEMATRLENEDKDPVADIIRQLTKKSVAKVAEDE